MTNINNLVSLIDIFICQTDIIKLQKMPGIKLKTPHASYVSELNGAIQIRSPISLKKQNNEPIGIYLQGLPKPNRRMILKFHPQTNVSADYLLWTVDGAILHVTFPKSSAITCGQILGNLTLHAYSLFAFIKQSNVAKFKYHNSKLAKTNII